MQQQELDPSLCVQRKELVVHKVMSQKHRFSEAF